MNYFETRLHWFQEQTLQRKLSLIGGMVFIACLTSALVFWVASPSYGILFSHLDNQDANQIITQLEQANIAYQLRNQGRDILIDKQFIDKTRIKLMGSDLQFTHSVGFELFDKSDFGMTDFSQKINYQRALQGELERTISSLDEVKAARVQLTIPEHHLFQQENNLPRVALTLHLKRTLTPQQVKSIQQLIMASVPNLPIHHVVMVDQNGNGLISNEDDPPSTHFSAKKKIERYLNEKVMQMLHPIFINERVMVKIDATLNYDELQRERIEPQHDGLITHEKLTRHSTANKKDEKQINQDITREKSYQLGSEKEQFTRANGTIERLTISVVLPKNTNPNKIEQVERLVKSVVGFNAERGDSMSIEALIVEPKKHVIDMVSVIPPSPQPSFFIDQNLIQNGLIGLMGSALLASFMRYRTRRIQRRQLLAELTLWLAEND